MARTLNHYEQAIEQTLLGRGATLVPVDERRVASVGGRVYKNFDYVLYRPGRAHWLVEVKGRRVARARSVNCWVTKGDLANLEGWREAFGPGFEPVFAFVFELPWHDVLESHFVHGERCYEAWLVELAGMQALARERSSSWGTMSLPSAAFRRIARPFLDEAAGAAPYMAKMLPHIAE